MLNLRKQFFSVILTYKECQQTLNDTNINNCEQRTSVLVTFSDLHEIANS